MHITYWLRLFMVAHLTDLKPVLAFDFCATIAVSYFLTKFIQPQHYSKYQVQTRAPETR
jgi:hypothetical protein